MIRYLKKFSSIRNLGRAPAAGQVVTLLILIITAMLIFTLVLVNIGQVSNYATNLSNAADAASMYMASQIGTKSFALSTALYNACGNPQQCCEKTGLLAVILAIILIILAFIVSIYCQACGAVMLNAGGLTLTGYAIVIGAGALGGAIGGHIAGTGATRGAITGGIIGLAIAMGHGAGLAAGAEFSAWVGAYSTAGLGTCVAIGATIGVTLAAASSIYTAYVADQMRTDAWAAAVNALNGLPEFLRRQETVFFQAFAETIDDPNKAQDTNDSDGDGDTAEYVPNFQMCWDRRVLWIKEGRSLAESQQSALVSAYLRGEGSPMGRFLSAVDAFLFSLNYEHQLVPYVDDYSNPTYEDIVVEGGIKGLFTALENAGYDISFFMIGPSLEDIEDWRNWDPFACGSCPPASGPCGTPWDPVNTCTPCDPPPAPSGYDEVDFDEDELNDFKALVGDLMAVGDEELAYNWRMWIGWFYVPDSGIPPGAIPADYYHLLLGMINGGEGQEPRRVGVRNWLDEVDVIRNRPDFPICTYGCLEAGPGGDDYNNPIGVCADTGSPCYDCLLSRIDPNTGRVSPPCQWHPSNPDFFTSDLDMEDEYIMARDAIDAFVSATEAYTQATRDFYNNMAALDDPEPLPADSPQECGLFGTNPAWYWWEDSRGTHSIRIRIGSYNEPQLVKRKYGNWLKGKTCMELDWYEQEINVQIARDDQVENQEMGLLGLWNPATVTRTSVAQYRGLKSYDDKCHPAGVVRVLRRY
jgi:hypothetical protein